MVALMLVGMPACHREKHQEPSPSASAPSATGSAPDDKASAQARMGARPPKPKATASAVPPSLPALHKQAAALPEKTHRPRKGPLLAEYPCGSVWTGEEEIGLECDEVVANDKKARPPATALIPYELLHLHRSNLPAIVDHRVDGFEGRVLAQGRAPACTAFALTSMINHALSLWTGEPGDISVMQVWARYHKPNGVPGIAANLGKTFAKDADWPYDAETAKSWAGCHQDGASCLQPADQQKLADADKKGIALLEEVEQIEPDKTFFDVIAAKLAAGRDVGMAGRLPKSFRPVGDAGSRYVPDFTEFGKGSHAFLTVGYTYVGDERYFLLKNSWGQKWGDQGYAWIHEQTLQKLSHHGGTVAIVEPVGSEGGRRHRRKRGWVDACAAGQGPDSVDGTCKPLCADGAPQHHGYCGVMQDCTKGFVNVSGECVLAAPSARGTEPKTGITFTCGPSGCLYTLPKGVEGCSAASCQKSCPAPDYRLGKGKSGLLCLE